MNLRAVSRLLHKAAEKFFGNFLRIHFPGVAVPGHSNNTNTLSRILRRSCECWVLEVDGKIRADLDGFEKLGVFMQVPEEKGSEVVLKEACFDTLCKLFCIRGPLPEVGPRVEDVEALGVWFRSGHRVFPSRGRLWPILNGLLPAGQWNCMAGKCVFSLMNKRANYEVMDGIFGSSEEENFNSFIICCDRPMFAAGVCGRDGNMYGFDDKPETHPILYGRNEKLLLNAIPIHGVVDERVEYYVKRFEADSTYAPTILLASFRQRSQFGTNGIIFDGHHKLFAAMKLQRAVQFILVESSNDGILPLEWAGKTPRDAFEFLNANRCNHEYFWDEATQLPKVKRRFGPRLSGSHSASDDGEGGESS